MSLIKSATRRLSLLASSSLAAAGIAVAGSAGVALVPTAAVAQAVCLPAPTSGAGTNSVTYAATTTATAYNPGITCTASGGAMTVTTGGAVTVSTTAGGNGVNLNATTEAINWNSTAGTLTGGAQTNGAVIEANTTSGAINIDTAAISRTGSTQTHGILARSTAGGSIDIATTGNVSMSSGAAGSIGIEAVASGGNGNIVINSAQTSGRLYSIVAQAAGAGAIQITGGAAVPNAGIAGILATTDAGGITYTATGNGLGAQNSDIPSAGIIATSTSGDIIIDAVAAGIEAGLGGAIRAQTGGDIDIEVGAGREILAKGGATGVIDLTVTAGAASIHNAGIITGTVLGLGGANRPINTTSLALSATGPGSLSFDNDGALIGRLALASLSGGADLSISAGLAEAGGWRTGGASTFGSGADAVTIEDGGMILASSYQINNTGELGAFTAIEFGGGEDLLENAGALIIGFRDDTGSGASYLSLTGLDTFDNAGVIYLGAMGARNSMVGALPDPESADSEIDDVLRMDSGIFRGLEGSRVIMDADLSKTQSNCTDRVTRVIPDTGTGEFTLHTLPAADCLDLRGASTEGTTMISLRQTKSGARGAYNPTGTVIVDVGGAGTSALGHFVLAPDSTGYTSQNGGVIDRGEFFYTIAYDEELQQHKLVGLPGQNLYQLPGLVLAAQSAWRTTTDTVISRPGERRMSPEGDGMGGSLWLRGTGDFASRDVEQSLEFLSLTYAFDNTFDQQTIAITGGGDMMWETDGSTFLVGATVGAARADLDYAASPNTVEMRGFTAGLYGGMTLGAFYVDAAVHGLGMTMENDMPALGLLPAGRVLTTKLQTIGAQAEAGWRMPLSETMFVEPLAAVSIAESEFDDMQMGVSGDFLFPGNVIEFDKSRTARAGAGARFGADADYGSMLMQFSLTGRIWHEAEGESAALVHSAGPDVMVADALTGTFSDIGGALAVSDETGTFNAFVEAGGKFGDDYQSTTVSGGVRYRW